MTLDREAKKQSKLKGVTKWLDRCADQDGASSNSGRYGTCNKDGGVEMMFLARTNLNTIANTFKECFYVGTRCNRCFKG